MKTTYDRLAAGDRLRLKRTLLGFSQEELSEKIGRVPKYYADIERGSCGMSVETLMALSKELDLSLDYIIYGKTSDANDKASFTDEVIAIMGLLNHSSKRKKKYALQLLRLFLIACDDLSEVEE